MQPVCHKQLEQICSQRWLKTPEIFQLLLNPPDSIHILDNLPQRPGSGSFFLINSQAKRGWKQDGYDYIPRSNGSGVREDVEKLKIQGKQQIVCYYSYIIPSRLENKDKKPYLYRRIYRLTQSNYPFFFVHYFSCDTTTNIKSDYSYTEVQPDYVIAQPTYNPNEQDFYQQEFFINENDDFIFQMSNQANLNKEENDYNEDHLKQRITELERRILSLESEKQTSSTQISQNSENSAVCACQIKIVEYSPEWDFVEGGAKFVLCYQPMIELNDCQILFGNKLVEARCLQPGVMKSFVPENEEGCVKINVYQYGKRIDDIRDRPCIFEYKKQKKEKKKKKSSQMLQKDSSYDAEFKIRVVEKLSGLQGFINQFQPNNSQSGDGDMFQEALFFDNEKESENQLTRLFQQLINIAESLKIPNNKLSDYLNEQDQNGFCLIHYLTALGNSYITTVKLLMKSGIDLNAVGVDELTPLQIAVIMNQEAMVDFLLQQGGINNNQGIKDIFSLDSLYDNKNIIDLLIRGATLCDSINNSSSITEHKSWNEQDEQEDLNYFQLNDICNEILLEEFEQEKMNQQKGAQKKDIKPKQHKEQYLRQYNNNTKSQVPNKTELPEQIEIKAYDNCQDSIKVIQKNVRCWLLRRQYLDMKYATQVLQNCNKLINELIDIRDKISKKHIKPECKQKIKDTLRNWLNLKQL